MADKELVKDRDIIKHLDNNQLKESVKLLNSAIEEWNSQKEEGEEETAKIRVVGIKKLIMWQKFCDTVDLLYDAEFTGLPAAVVEYYNSVYDPENGLKAKLEDEILNPTEGDEEAEEEEKEAEVKKEKTKAKKQKPADKKEKEKKKPSVPRYTNSFEDIKKRLKNPPTPTSQFDAMCLKGGKLEHLLAKFKKYLSDSGIPFRSLNTINAMKSHIKYRQNQGYIYEEEGGKIKMVGFEAKK